jgi:NTP pyrophosphatase (non-canonical NTP hydrolase)
MFMDSFQKAAHEFAGPNITLEECVLALNEEAGEVAGKLKRWYRGDYHPEQHPGMASHDVRDSIFAEGDLRADIVAELGDVLWYLSETATQCGATLEEIASNVLTKLEDRATRGVIQGSGDNR